VTFDEERATQALGLLKDMARDLQVILITTSDRYDALADNVVVLPAPTERDGPEPVGPTPSAESMSVWSSTALPPAEPRPTAPRQPVAVNNGAANGNAPTSTVEPAPLWPEEH
jgi:hypothetical protein